MNHPEHRIQSAVIQWARRYKELALLYAIPNGGHRDIRVARKMKAEGVLPGIPDLCLPVARHGYNALYIEMKTESGRVTAQQKAVHVLLEYAGNHVAVCKCVEDAIGVLARYVGIENPF